MLYWSVDETVYSRCPWTSGWMFRAVHRCRSSLCIQLSCRSALSAASTSRVDLLGSVQKEASFPPMFPHIYKPNAFETISWEEYTRLVVVCPLPGFTNIVLHSPSLQCHNLTMTAEIVRPLVFCAACDTDNETPSTVYCTQQYEIATLRELKKYMKKTKLIRWASLHA